MSILRFKVILDLENRELFFSILNILLLQLESLKVYLDYRLLSKININTKKVLLILFFLLMMIQNYF